MTHSYNTQDKKKVQPQIGRTFCSRDSLLKWSLSYYKFK